MAKVIAIGNNKGGIGKTTTAANLATGLVSECLGLCWSDLDFEKRIIKVCKTLIYRPEPNNGCVVHISTPKTEAGERTIPMIDEVYDVFLEEYQIQKVLGFVRMNRILK